jgi:tRNA (adenine57-N1/adenine58-N1)-methyltransferase catalytic subunit
MFIYPRMYRQLKRGPQVILPKDIGMIIAYAGVGKESVCIDAGTGSGWLAVSLARVSKKVYSYDTRKEFTEIAKKNKEILSLDNLYLKTGDVTKGVKERNADIFTLDLPSAEKALPTAKKALKPDGVVVGYLPHTEQLSTFAAKLHSLGFYDIYSIECIVRDILVRKEGVRPDTQGLWHTAYLIFARNASRGTKKTRKAGKL